jgi:hypothetical protein
MELIAESNDENADTHEVVVISTLNLLGSCLNDLPTQIPKMIANGLVPEILHHLERRIPKQSNYFHTILKFLIFVRVHDEGKNCLRNSKIVESLLAVPLQPGYSELFIGSEKCIEYNKLFNDLLRDDDELLPRAYKQVLNNFDEVES